MTVKVKITLSVLIAILLGGAGYFFIINKPAINTVPKTEEIDTSDWQTYRNETLGFEIRFPKTMSKQGEYIGNPIPDAPEFWQDQVGQVWFITTKPPGSQFIVKIKDSDLTMDDFGFRGDPSITINNLFGRRRTKFPEGTRSKTYSDFVLINNGRRYYKIEFLSTNNPSKQEIEAWNTILNTFKPIP